MYSLLPITLAVPVVGALLWLVFNQASLKERTGRESASASHTRQLLESATCRQMGVDGDGHTFLVDMIDAEPDCVANASCGVLYFPSTSQSTMALVIDAMKEENISSTGVLDFILEDVESDDSEVGISRFIDTTSNDGRALAYLIQSYDRTSEDNSLNLSYQYILYYERIL